MKLRVLSFVLFLMMTFPALAQYNASGDAVQTSCDCYTLTAEEIAQVGSVWNVNLIDLNDSFYFSFDIFLGCNDGLGADGMAFGLQPLGTGIGTAGNGMGMTGVNPSIGVFFDTFQNATDPADDHIAINSNGNVLHDGGADDLAGPISLGNIEDCLWHELQIEWDSGAQTLSAFLDGVLQISYTGDIINDIFSGNPEVYWGFTSSTGAAFNEHKICTQVNSEIAIDFPILCADQEVEFYDNSESTNGVVGWEWNFGDGTFSSDQNPIHVYDELGDFEIELTITDVSGCQSSDIVPVEVIGPYSGESASAEVCPQDTEFTLIDEMDGADDAGYWLDSNGDPMPDLLNALVYPEGTYTYVVESDLCPTVASTLDITYSSICNASCTMTPFTVEVVDNVCFGGSLGELSIDAIQGLEYSIDNGLTFQASPNFTDLNSGFYDVVVQYESCQKTDVVEINSPSQVFVEASEDVTICIDGSTTVQSSANGGVGAYEYFWDNGLGAGQNHSVEPDEQVCYTVYAEDSNGCVSETDEICIDLFPPLEIEVSEDQVLCPGLSADLDAFADGGSGVGYQFIWYENEEVIDNGPQVTVSPLQSQEYCVVLVDNCTTPGVSACSEVNVPWLYPQFIAEQEIGCAPQEIEFYNLTDQEEIVSATWSFSDGSEQEDMVSTDHIFENDGCYDVTLQVVSNIGCEYEVIQNDMVCIDDYPTADFTFGPQPTSVSNPFINFTNQSGGSITYEWYFPEDCLPNYSEEEDLKVQFPDDGPGEYVAELVAISSLGCRDSIQYTVEIQGEMVVYVPNAFSPDGDGVNEVFHPVILLPDEIKYFNFRIINRWGEEVFLTQSPDEYWTGESPGQTHYVEDDVYMWTIELKLKDKAEIESISGFVTVLR